MTSRPIATALLALAFLAFTAHDADAAEVRTGERVHVAADTTIDADLYAAAREVIIDGVVHGDVIVAGSRIRIHGRVEGSVMAVGETVIIDGKIGRALRLAGNDVRMDGEVGTDAIAACGTCSLGSTGKVGVDLFLAGSALNLGGTVTGGLRAAGKNVRLAGAVQKDAQVRAETLQVEVAAATPSLIYGAKAPALVASGARIGHLEKRSDWTPTAPNRSAGSLFGTLTALVSGAVLWFLLRERSTSASQLLSRRPGASLLYGFLVALAGPVVILLGMITVIGIPLSMMAASIYAFAMHLGYLSSAHFLGERTLKTLHRQSSAYAAFALGLALLGLVSQVPLLGGIVRALATLAGLGSLWLLLVSSQWFSARFRRTGAVADAAPAMPAAAP